MQENFPPFYRHTHLLFFRSNRAKIKLPHVVPEDFMKDYPRFPKIDDVVLKESEKFMYIDLTPYMHAAPYIVRQKTTLLRAFRIFRTIGMRHMIVVDDSAKVIGMITRHNFALFREEALKKQTKSDGFPFLGAGLDEESALLGNPTEYIHKNEEVEDEEVEAEQEAEKEVEAGTKEEKESGESGSLVDLDETKEEEESETGQVKSVRLIEQKLQ